jgi:hypothetical protein
MKRLFFCATLCALVFSAPLGAQSFFGRLEWAFRGAILFLPEDNGLEGDPAPILPTLGAAVAHPITGPLLAEVSLDLWHTWYGYSDALQRPVPLALENRWSGVLDFVLGFVLMSRFDITDSFALRAYGGPSFDFKLCLPAADLNSSDMNEANRQTDAVASYFWGAGRWFLPAAGLGFDWAITGSWTLGLDMRVWFPLYRVWTGEELPAVEGWRFSFGLRIGYRSKEGRRAAGQDA